jgi:hypothetical protein
VLVCVQPETAIIPTVWKNIPDQLMHLLLFINCSSARSRQLGYIFSEKAMKSAEPCCKLYDNILKFVCYKVLNAKFVI